MEQQSGQAQFPFPGNHGLQRQLVVLLVAAGARVEVEWKSFDKVRADAAMLAALQGKAL